MNIYLVIIHSTKGYSYHMPYKFTSLKEAILYGEYNYRKHETTAYYEIEKLLDISKFYKLK